MTDAISIKRDLEIVLSRLFLSAALLPQPHAPFSLSPSSSSSLPEPGLSVDRKSSLLSLSQLFLRSLPCYRENQRQLTPRQSTRSFLFLLLLMCVCAPSCPSPSVRSSCFKDAGKSAIGKKKRKLQMSVRGLTDRSAGHFHPDRQS